MSSLDENILGRIAILNNYILPKQFEECLKIQRTEPTPRGIGEILRERGYLSPEHLDAILAIRKKKIRRSQRNNEDSRVKDRSFGEIALRESLISLDDLEDAILEQEKLLLMNLHFRLGEILVARSRLKVSDVLGVLHRQGKRILLCPACDVHYNMQGYREGKEYRCVHCNGPLEAPRFLETVAVDEVLQG
jgi:hypothetical protein